MVIANMDFDSFFRNKIENMLITASWVEPVQHMLNLKAVSQVWGDKPEWYIWLAQAPGVYALVLEDAETFKTEDTTLCMGHFAIKCYPYVDDGIFTAFSSQEQEMAASDLFDETHTPRLEVRERIPETFFAVGSISIILDEAETIALFTVDSLDALRLCVHSVSEGQWPSSANTVSQGIIRNVPGWQISYPLFDRLIGLYSFQFRQPPVFIGATRSPGFEYLVNAEQNMECRSCTETQQLAASLLFLKTSPVTSLVDTIWREPLGPEEKIMFMRDLPSSFSNQLSLECPQEVPINALWWELANTELKSELSSTCGCCNHPHNRCSVS
jgi:hypothetical protein